MSFHQQCERAGKCLGVLEKTARHGGNSHCSDPCKTEKGWEAQGLELLIGLGREAAVTAPSKSR